MTTLLIANETSWRVTGVVEQRIRVTPQQVRICDVAMLRDDAPRERVTATAPYICSEIMAPEDRLSRAKPVLQDYLHLGGENIWLLDPQRRSWYTFDANGLHQHTGPFTVSDTTICVDIEALFARLD